MTEQDKQALIEYYCQRDCGHTRGECCLDNCHEIMLIEEFPTTPTDTDTISRQAALDVIRPLQTYKLFEGDDMILVDKAEVQTELMMLPSAELGTNLAEVGTDVPDINDGELISRQQAIDALVAETIYTEEELKEYYEANSHRDEWVNGIYEAIEGIKQLPPIQPKRGKWLPDNNNYIYEQYVCSECKNSFKVDTCMGKPKWNFCPYCGARMER